MPYKNLHPEFVNIILKTNSNSIPSKLHRDLAFTDSMVKNGLVTFNYDVFKTMRKYEVSQCWHIFLLGHMKVVYNNS